MAVDWNWVLIIVGALLVLVEAALGGFAGFDLVLIGTSIAAGGALGLVVGSPQIGFVTAAALSVVYIVAGRRWVRARLRRPGVTTNTDALVGQRGLVTEPVAPHAPGQIRVHGEVWRARPVESETGAIEAGAEVTIEGVDGVTLLVRRAS